MGRGAERHQRNCLPHEGCPATRPVHGVSAPTQKRGAAGTCRGEHEVGRAIAAAAADDVVLEYVHVYIHVYH